MGKTVAIHQPNYLPYPGYFFKILHADEFVFLDNVMYSSGGASAIINRNRIKTTNGVILLTVPVRKSSGHRLIGDTEIDYQQPWVKKHLKTFWQAYRRAPYFEEVYTLLDELLCTDYPTLAELNITIITKLCEHAKIPTMFHRSSQLSQIGKHKNGILISILASLGANTYLSGEGGRKYMDLEDFALNNIEVVFSGYTPKRHLQQHGDFEYNLSFIDMLFNCGKNSIGLL